MQRKRLLNLEEEIRITGTHHHADVKPEGGATP